MDKVIDWYLPEEVLDLISNCLFSNVELLRFRSICKTWRSSAAINKRFLNDLNRNCNRRRILPPWSGLNSSLSPAAFYRVVLSSCPEKGWLIKTQDVDVEDVEDVEDDEDVKYVEYGGDFKYVEYGGDVKDVEYGGDVEDVEVSSKKQLLFPLSRRSINSSDKTLDLLKYTVSEICQSYDVDYFDFDRVVVVKDLVLVVDYKKQIWCCRSGDDVWTRIMDEEVKQFSDIILHKGHVYALDLTGAIWWISLSELQIYQFGPSTPLDYYKIDSCKEKRLVEYCEEGLSVIHRFSKKLIVKGYHIERTIGFKVYQMDEELVQWVEVKSLGNKAIVMATDSCFSVVASEYYGCLESSIYFTDGKMSGNVKVFKLGDGSITNRVDSFSQSCFQMLSPPFI